MLLNLLLTAAMTCANVPAADAELKALDIAQIAAMAETEPECWQARIHLGRASLEDDRLDEGIAHFEAAAKLAPGESAAHAWLGLAYLTRAGARSSLDDAEAGVRELEKAIALDPENLDARQTLASFHRSAPWIAGGDMDVADEQAEYVRQRDPLRGLLMLAKNRAADGDEDEAIALLRDVVTEHPEWDEGALALGLLYHREERFDDAFAILNRQAAGEGANPLIFYQLGRTAALSGRFLDEGRKAMLRYIALAEADDSLDMPASAAWWRLGVIEQHAGNTDAAGAAYRKALELDPDNEDAQRALKSLQ